jgi:putative Ca2+/H+ antiporter (TMEM165/GDT1 family)
MSLAKWREDPRESMRNVIQLLTSPVFAQAFVLTFLGEWGDRSQITTIAMGGAHVSSSSETLWASGVEGVWSAERM